MHPFRRRSSRWITAGAIAALGLTALTACSTNAATTTSPSTPGAGSSSSDIVVAKINAAAAALPGAIAKSGVLSVAIPTNEPPTQFFKPGTQVMTGINPDIARLVASGLGLKLKIDVSNFDSIIPGLQAGRFDTTVSSMTPTTVRMKALDFVNYVNMGSALVVLKSNPQSVSFGSLCGLKTAMLIGSYQLTANVPTLDAKCKATGQKPIVVQQFQATNDAISSLVSGRSTVVYADGPILSYAAKQNPEIKLAGTNDVAPVAIGIPKGSELTKAISIAMDQIIKTPQYKQVLDRYGIADMAITDASVNLPQ